jgi:exopolysaccharide production protein ExoY
MKPGWMDKVLLLQAEQTDTARGAPFRWDPQRIVDVTVALAAFVLLLPLLAATALAVWAADGGSIFYGHTRVGRMGFTFRCWKFRSMVMNSDQVLKEHLAENPIAHAEWEADRKLKKDPRITRLGHFLRKTSIDELPQLWNVLIGEMSLVGPRPIVVEEIAHYAANFHDYCQCRPGITGLWQVSGRNDISYSQRVALDVKYAKSRSVWVDLAIMAATVPAVLSRRGSY